MNYNENYLECQLSIDNYLNENKNYLFIPSSLTTFHNTSSEILKSKIGRNVIFFNGEIDLYDEDRICNECGCVMEINNQFNVTLKHLCFGSSLSCLTFVKKQFYCPNCHYSKMQDVPFQADGHRITKELEQYTIDLLVSGYTNKEVSDITGLGKNVVKEIDLKRLKEIYVKDGSIIKPENQAKFLGIDEFKLHNGHKYATHIIDLETGHILWIARGKKKQVVYDFIKHVGTDWMKNVVAVACDMNSDFEEAFIEKCPHISIVFDYFHIIKNFNDNVVNEIRKKEYKKLTEEKKYDEAKQLKKSKYILTSSKATLKQKDLEVLQNKVVEKGSSLFKIDEIVRKGNYEEKYNELIKNNELFFIADIIKEKLKLAFSRNNSSLMAEDLVDIAILCNETKDKNFKWFSRLIIKHFDGIITHTRYKISTGKIEGINNKIKTLRRQAYGYPDDEYFFLKLFDMSRH